jgi:hypothetical protein
MLASAVLAAFMAPAAPSQTEEAPTTVKSYAFSFDFSAPPSEAAELQEVQLHFSVDQGRTWKLYRGVPPSDGKITFEAAGDGEYWFAVQQVYKDGRRRPPQMEGVTPQRKVVVDATAPRVDLQPLSGDGRVGLEWVIRGDDADLSTLRLDARPAGKNEWSPVSVTPTRTGQKTWVPDAKTDYEIRLRIADRAGNETSRSVFASPSRDSSGRLASGGEVSSDRPRAAADRRLDSGVGSRRERLVPEGQARATPVKGRGAEAPSSAPTYFVNKTRFQVDYKVEALGKSGCKAVQLFWRYPDEDEWQDYGQNTAVDAPYKVAVTGEGKYGLRLRAVSGVGLAEELPQPGAPPQLWVVVDTTPPTVQLDVPKVKFATPMEVAISWRVSDDNPGDKKVKLFYASVDGPDAGRLKQIAKDLPNEGSHRWQPPADAPYRFKLRVEVEDAAGNYAHDETTEPVSIDDSRPRAVAIKVEAVSDGDEPKTGRSEPDSTPKSPVKRPPASLDPDDLAPSVKVGKKPIAPDDGLLPPAGTSGSLGR